MARQPKLYSMPVSIPAGLNLNQPAHVRQCRGMVATTSQKAAAELFQVSVNHIRDYATNPGLANGGFALTEPGVVFYAPLNERHPQWVRADGTPATTPEPTEFEPKNRRYFTAGELADILANIPSDTPIFVPGMEEGVNYATSLDRTDVELFANVKDYEGQHAEKPAPMFRDRDPRAFADHGYTLRGTHIQETR